MLENRPPARPRVLFAAFALAWTAAGYAPVPGDAEPRLPCSGQSPLPAFAMEPRAPNVRVWSGWAWGADCLAWPPERFKFIIAVGGTFAHAEDSSKLLARLGAISGMRGLRYWSVTDSDWRVLVKDAWATDGPDALQRRADFRADEMTAGSDRYFVEEDNRSSDPITYRMRVLDASPDRVAVELQNLTPVRYFGFVMLPPGSLRAAYFMQRLDSETWGFYEIFASGEQASALVELGKASYTNRARALYAHFTGTSAEAQ